MVPKRSPLAVFRPRRRVGAVGTRLDVDPMGEVLARSNVVLEGYWQQPDATADAVASSLAALAAADVGCWFIRGNRDFLLGHDYAARCAMRLLPDPCVFPIHGEPVMLSHGDLLCIDDHGYQQFRRQVRSLEWQQAFLQRSVDERRAFAAHARAESARHQSGQDAAITDANPDEVLRQLNLYGVRRLVHGHTHRPAVHELLLPDGQPAQRIVLGDWYEQGSVLRVDGGDWQLHTLA